MILFDGLVYNVSRRMMKQVEIAAVSVYDG